MTYDLLIDASAEYDKAVRLGKPLTLGKKEKQTLPVLDDILKERKLTALREFPLGLVQIPVEQIAGTKTAGRVSAFSKDFYPLLDSQTEFASKWMSLYKAHLTEGIREPIKAYEFMNKFYVEEGNKRVSVLKYCGAVSIPGIVTRLIPPRSEDKETKLYYEFMDFYKLSSINYLSFTEYGSFAKLQHLVGKKPDETWSDEDRLEFNSNFHRFTLEYTACGGNKLPITPADAFLTYIGIYDYQQIGELSSSQLKDKVQRIWNEFPILTTDTTAALQMDPNSDADSKMNLISKLLNTPTTLLASAGTLHVAFIHEKTAKTSGWTYAHELGRLHINEIFKEQITTSVYENTTEDNAAETIAQAIADGSQVIFTTSPPLLKASLTAAVDNPKVKILNCSLNTSHHYVRTYYARMYEAKFLMGAIAGTMADNNRIGYIADYPIYGMIANINAFALGAQMVNPRAKVYLEWSTMKNHNVYEALSAQKVEYICGRDNIVPGEPSRHFGLYRADDTPLNLAMPVWNWGKFYEQMIRNILNGSWKQDDTSNASTGVNYWWGMSTSIIDIFCSKHLPIGTTHLINLLKQTICQGDFNPFSGILYSQNGLVHKNPDKSLSPDEIVTMDWLSENVIGYIPKLEELVDNALPVVRLQGVEKN